MFYLQKHYFRMPIVNTNVRKHWSGPRRREVRRECEGETMCSLGSGWTGNINSMFLTIVWAMFTYWRWQLQPGNWVSLPPELVNAPARVEQVTSDKFFDHSASYCVSYLCLWLQKVSKDNLNYAAFARIELKKVYPIPLASEIVPLVVILFIAQFIVTGSYSFISNRHLSVQSNPAAKLSHRSRAHLRCLTRHCFLISKAYWLFSTPQSFTCCSTIHQLCIKWQQYSSTITIVSPGMSTNTSPHWVLKWWSSAMTKSP